MYSLAPIFPAADQVTSADYPEKINVRKEANESRLSSLTPAFLSCGNVSQDAYFPKLPLNTSTRLTFAVATKFSGPIPGFIQFQIRNLVVDIAVKELKKYAEGSRVDLDLATRPIPAHIFIQRSTDGQPSSGKISRRLAVSGPFLMLESIIEHMQKFVHSVSNFGGDPSAAAGAGRTRCLCPCSSIKTNLYSL